MKCQLAAVLCLSITSAFSVLAGDVDADIDKANSYDDAWEYEWVDHLRSIYENTTLGGGSTVKTDGFVIHLGDSITHASQYAWVNLNGATTIQSAITWMKAGGIDSGTDADNKNGWQLAICNHPAGGRGYTGVPGITAVQYLTGNKETFAAGSGDTHPLNTLLNNLTTAPYPLTAPDPAGYSVAIIHDAMIAIVMLGTNDTNVGRFAVDTRVYLNTMIDKLIAKDIMPVLSTIPPIRGKLIQVEALNVEIRQLAQTRRIPVIDFWSELIRRRPGTTWDGTLMQADGLHPTGSEYGGAYQDPVMNPQYLSDSGYTLRGFLSVCKVREIKSKVIDSYLGTLTIITTTIPDLYSNNPMSAIQFEATNGTPSYSWTATGLPAGLVLSSGGQLSGTPTTSGVFTANITVTDSAATNVTRPFSITIIAGTTPISTTLNAVKDTYVSNVLAGDDATNFGASLTIATQGNNGDSYKSVGLVQFDLSASELTNAHINSAKLRLFCNGEQSGKGGTIRVFNINLPWTETGATFLTTDATNLWTGGSIVGGPLNVTAEATDYNHASLDPLGASNPYYVSGSFPNDDWTGCWIEFDVTDITQSWISGDTDNNGLAITATAYVQDPLGQIDKNYGYNLITYRTKEQGTAPQLLISYQPEDLPNTAGIVAFTSATFSVNENAGTLIISVSRTGGTLGVVSVTVNSSDNNATSGNDYTAVINNMVSWADGDNGIKSITVLITDDSLFESNETFTLTISSPTGGVSMGIPSTATITIIDDETPQKKSNTNSGCEFSLDNGSIRSFWDVIVIMVSFALIRKRSILRRGIR
ncbi:MAG: DNRLRE domain-containing protein [Planctomycetota bacterium]